MRKVTKSSSRPKMALRSCQLIAACILLADVISSRCVPPDAPANMTRRERLNCMLNQTTYDPRVPPDYEKNVPTNVSIKIHLLSFDSVSETRMDYSVEMFLTEEWYDERLHFYNATDLERLEVDSKMMDSVWVPDVYFRNEKEGNFHEVTVPNKYMHLMPNGRVVYSMRLSLTLNCRMNLLKYPLDRQRCPMMIQSYTYTTDNVMFYWADNRPIRFDADLKLEQELPQFVIIDNETASCETKPESGHPGPDPTFACITAYFTLQRDIRYYIIQIYVPSILIVALSWVSFWLDLEAIPARVSLGVLTVLTLNTHGSTIQASLPKVSYIKAIDVWVVSSLIFVFSAFLEFAYVNVLTRRGDKEMAIAQVFMCKHNEADTVHSQVNGTSTPKFVVRKVTGEMNRHIPVDAKSNSRIKARRVDKISRVLFPVAFIIFNLIYWIVYIFIDV